MHGHGFYKPFHKKSMKRTTSKLHAILIASLFFASACGNGNNAGNGAQNAMDTMAAKADTAMDHVKNDAQAAAGAVEGAVNKNEDSDFVVKAALTNNAELKVLQAGIDNGTGKEVNAHARMMIADHKKLGEKVKAYATKKGYTLPDGDNGKGDDVIATLNKSNKGADWDKAWVDHMVSAHKDAIDMFERGQAGVKDDELKNIIAGALPTLHSHLDMMQKLQDKLGK
jgi:putative membrane protein